MEANIHALLRDGLTHLNIMTEQILISTTLENMDIFSKCLKELKMGSSSCFLNGDHITAKVEKIESWV